MSWWDKNTKPEDIPPELKDLTPAQLAEAVRKSSALETELNATRQKVDAQEEQLSELASLKQKIAALEANPNNQPKPESRPQNQPISFLEDEDAAFNQRAQPIVGAVYTMGAQIARSNFETKLSGVDAKMFQKYGADVDKVMESVDVASKANPQAWQNAWNMVKGQHLDEITKAAQDRSDFFSETVQGSSLGGPPRTVLPDDKLTPEEEKQAKKYGVDPKDFLESRKSMVIYHD